MSKRVKLHADAPDYIKSSYAGFVKQRAQLEFTLQSIDLEVSALIQKWAAYRLIDNGTNKTIAEGTYEAMMAQARALLNERFGDGVVIVKNHHLSHSKSKWAQAGYPDYYLRLAEEEVSDA